MALGHKVGEIVDSDSILTCDTDGAVGKSSPTIAKDSRKTHAGKAVEIVKDGTNGDHTKLSTADSEIFGRVKLVESDGKAPIETAGINMKFPLKTADTTTGAGDRLVGAGDGDVKGVSDPGAVPGTLANTAAARTEIHETRLWARGKGRVTQVYTVGTKKYANANFRS